VKNVFVLASDTLNRKLTVIANNADEAIYLYYLWTATHCRAAHDEEPAVERLSAEQLALQPQLSHAASEDVAGIAYWVSHRAGWVVAVPESGPLGRSMPPETSVRCFTVDVTGRDEVFVFAHDTDHALSLYNHFQLAAWGKLDSQFTIREMSRWLLQGYQVTLREEMDSGITGIGKKALDAWWHIYAPDDEPGHE
jgi:hypothetical protein